MLNRPVVDWIAPHRRADGYGKHARGMVCNMPGGELDLSAIEKGGGRSVELSEEQNKYFKRHEVGHRNDHTKGKTEAIEVWQFNPMSAVVKGAHSYHCPDIYSILFTVYESPEIPQHWTGICDGYDEIWLPSYHAKDAFRTSKIRDDMHYEVFPEAVSDHYTEEGPCSYHFDDYLFLSLFDFTFRKGWDKLLEAYCREFDPSEEVRLMIKTHYGGGTEEDEEYVKERITEITRYIPDIPRFGILWDWIPERELPALYRSADSFVLPTRGEGWGLPLGEAAACGLPVITTKHFAPTEYLDDNTYWVDVQEMVSYPYSEAKRNEPNCTGLPFAEPDLDSLMEQMRKVYEQGHEAVSPDVSDLSWKESAQACTRRLKEIWERKGG